MSNSNPTKREFELLDRIHRLKMENNDLLNRLAREAPDAWQDYNSIKHYQRENAALRKCHLQIAAALDSKNPDCRKWAKEITELRADKDRLDWMQNGGNAVDDVLYDMNVQIDFDVRAAIDAARKEVQS
ncbi:MAG: hypothetical protein EBR82_10535 [Caulobacteraceae bacterium]|nr:hypothetical protein [Caulobacteraceae bacterium]